MKKNKPATAIGRTKEDWDELIRRELIQESETLRKEAEDLPRLLEVGCNGLSLRHVPKLLYSVNFIMDYLLAPSTEISPVVVNGLSDAIRECAERTSVLIARDAEEKLRAVAPEVKS